jgi:hypothetical protein
MDSGIVPHDANGHRLEIVGSRLLLAELYD